MQPLVPRTSGQMVVTAPEAYIPPYTKQFAPPARAAAAGGVSAATRTSARVHSIVPVELQIRPASSASCSQRAGPVKHVPRHGHQSRRPRHKIGRRSRGGDLRQIDPGEAMRKVSQLKAELFKDPDPPAVAGEMAELYRVLSDHRRALKCFRLAIKTSPERVPTKKEIDERETFERKLLLLSEAKRAQSLVKLEAREKAKRLARQAIEQRRRKQAARGIFECLLALRDPVQAAGAAVTRLRMCDSDAERLQVELQIHDTLLMYETLVEPEATNQGAWLTESAGALCDLHASVLKSLLACRYASSKSSAQLPLESSQEQSTDGAPGETQGRGAETECPKPASMIESNVPLPAVTRNDPGRVALHEAGNPDISPGTSLPSDRTLLRHLGALFARKRQFAASRQAFEESIRDGPDERIWRQRYESNTSKSFVDWALDEAKPTIEVNIHSRWQSGVERDAERLRTLADFTGFTGVHRGAETLVTAFPAGGWADGSADLAYAERLSRSRVAVEALTSVDSQTGLSSPPGANESSRHTTSAGVMSTHVVPATNVQLP